MVPAQTPPSSPSVSDRTLPITLAATLAVAAAMVVVFWPQAPQTPEDPLALAEFDDEITGRAQLIVPLGDVTVADLPADARASVELRLQTPPPAKEGELTAGITLLVQAQTPQLLDAPAEATIKVATVEGPIPLRRIEIEDHGVVTSGLYGEIPWGLVIGLSTGAPGALVLGERTVTFPPTTQAQVLKALRRAKAQGRSFMTFGVDITQDRPTSPPAPAAEAQPSSPAAAPAPASADTAPAPTVPPSP